MAAQNLSQQRKSDEGLGAPEVTNPSKNSIAAVSENTRTNLQQAAALEYLRKPASAISSGSTNLPPAMTAAQVAAAREGIASVDQTLYKDQLAALGQGRSSPVLKVTDLKVTSYLKNDSRDRHVLDPKEDASRLSDIKKLAGVAQSTPIHAEIFTFHDFRGQEKIERIRVANQQNGPGGIQLMTKVKDPNAVSYEGRALVRMEAACSNILKEAGANLSQWMKSNDAEIAATKAIIRRELRIPAEEEIRVGTVGLQPDNSALAKFKDTSGETQAINRGRLVTVYRENGEVLVFGKLYFKNGESEIKTYYCNTKPQSVLDRFKN